MTQQAAHARRAARPSITDTREPDIQRVFRTIKIVLAGYLAVGLALLVIDVGQATSGHGAAVSSFMWSRSSGIVASGAVFLWFADAASRGRRWAFRRLQIVSVAVPLVVVGLVLVLAAGPLWFRLVQLVCAVCMAAVAFLVYRPRLRHAFG